MLETEGRFKISRDEALKVWDVLLRNECVSPDTDVQEAFVRELSAWPYEYRFRGSLGHGGKVWIDQHDWEIGCYESDETPERLKKINAVNRQLAELKKELGYG